MKGVYGIIEIFDLNWCNSTSYISTLSILINESSFCSISINLNIA